MQRSCKELKRIARENLENKYSVPMRAYLLSTCIIMLVEMPFSTLQTQEQFSTQNIILYIAELLISIVAIVLTCGEYRIHLSIAKNQKPNLMDLFYPVKNHPDRYILGRLLYLGIMIIALLPLVLSYILIEVASGMLILLAIPLSIVSCILAILVAMNFDLVFLFMLDDENLTIIDAFKKCRNIMKGNKGRYFYMSLSFVGMLLLVALSLGIAILWVQPYITQTTTAFYLDITGQLDQIEETKKIPQPEPKPCFDQYI
ncbi:MAG: DUF975 family protein [Lachnospiraceae bacterium]|nr:DUF975 family protein [Lachnospiraceae bacterium]